VQEVFCGQEGVRVALAWGQGARPSNRAAVCREEGEGVGDLLDGLPPLKLLGSPLPGEGNGRPGRAFLAGTLDSIRSPWHTRSARRYATPVSSVPMAAGVGCLE
jgi:hypothetical protein